MAVRIGSEPHHFFPLGLLMKLYNAILKSFVCAAYVVLKQCISTVSHMGIHQPLRAEITRTHLVTESP